MIALILAAHICPVPLAAWVMNRDLTVSEYRSMERFGECVCGPDGTVDWDARPHKRGGYFMHPSCNRNGWNGKRYVEPRSKKGGGA